MYLTEELFHSTDHDHPSAMAWKATSPDPHSSTESLGKRKRGADNGGEYTVCAIPSKNIKAAAGPVHYDYETALSSHHLPQPLHLSNAGEMYPPASYMQQATAAGMRGRKRAGMTPRLHRPVSAFSSIDSTIHVPPPPAPKGSSLAPCHCCHKAPRMKKDLEGYMACESCREQTCFICMRQCQGVAPGCGERKICRSCCIERGEEGETWCLNCLGQMDEGHGA
ncbi:uncharacterized protein K452DRAFT_294033 [Aplosporella prunicola CBS 121167]|uniref:Uncharacterized protein n=1 Tax=Aplosporella prunicola CBS 121167 TaxID=1176127 RepID=A0A6A6BQU2_9PEZI|nr:uncharacterized protein K452DRAFT_294033 [Aplosporella prunicola CBS 121167]KAF2146456.1 hypothetical protein K452DRAFT_294033 [Aplosporella prunicola CBS 121167]